MKKITLLAASALLLLTACGQVENSPAEVVPPLAIETQEDVRQLQATPERSAAAQKPDTVSDAAQEQPQKEKAPQTDAGLRQNRQDDAARRTECHYATRLCGTAL